MSDQRPTEVEGARSSAPVAMAAASVAVTVWGLSGVIAKDIDMGGLAIAGYRFSLFGLVVGLLMAGRGRRLTVRVMRVSMAGGIALGLDVALFFSAVKLTTIANATVISALQPVFVAIIAARFFGERIIRRDMLLAAVALTGVVAVILGAVGSEGWSMTGDVLAFLAVVAWAAYFVFSKRAQREISSSEYTLGAAVWTGLINLGLAALVGQDLSWPTTRSWVGLGVLAFGAGLLGHSLMNWSITQIPLWLVSTMTLLIPVVSASAAWIWLGEDLSAVQVAAIGVVLVALAGIVGRQSGIGSRPRPLRR